MVIKTQPRTLLNLSVALFLLNLFLPTRHVKSSDGHYHLHLAGISGAAPDRCSSDHNHLCLCVLPPPLFSKEQTQFRGWGGQTIIEDSILRTIANQLHWTFTLCILLALVLYYYTYTLMGHHINVITTLHLAWWGQMEPGHVTFHSD